MAIDHASLSRLDTVSTPDRHSIVWDLLTFLLYFNKKRLSHPLPGRGGGIGFGLLVFMCFRGSSILRNDGTQCFLEPDLLVFQYYSRGVYTVIIRNPWIVHRVEGRSCFFSSQFLDAVYRAPQVRSRSKHSCQHSTIYHPQSAFN